MNKQIECVICKKYFLSNIHNKKVCSKECRNKYHVLWNKKYNEKNYIYRK